MERLRYNALEVELRSYELEKEMNEHPEYKVLDHGYVKLIEAWGAGIEGRDLGLDSGYPSDFEVGIIEAARMSTGKGFEGWEKDSRLLKYLYENKHATPFEMAGMVIEVQAPIFVFREWHRHRTQSYNEMSGRYIPLPDLNYTPDFFNLMERVRAQTDNKQAQGVLAGDHPRSTYELWLEELEMLYKHAQEVYNQGLQIGVPKELARLPVPVARYSRMRASANLRNWLAFLTLRLDKKAQWEIRQYAYHVGSLISLKFPRTWNLFQLSK